MSWEAQGACRGAGIPNARRGRRCALRRPLCGRVRLGVADVVPLTGAVPVDRALADTALRCPLAAAYGPWNGYPCRTAVFQTMNARYSLPIRQCTLVTRRRAKCASGDATGDTHHNNKTSGYENASPPDHHRPHDGEIHLRRYCDAAVAGLSKVCRWLSTTKRRARRSPYRDARSGRRQQLVDLGHEILQMEGEVIKWN